jgi:hypothetical protein
VLLAKLQERQGPQQNPQVQLIYVEPHREYPRFVVITRGSTATGEDRAAQGKIENDHGVRKAIEKPPMIDANKERHIFKEARKEFKRGQGYPSKRQLEIKEYGMPQAFDPSALPTEGKEVSKLMEFLCTCVKMIQDKGVVQELQDLIK